MVSWSNGQITSMKRGCFETLVRTVNFLHRCLPMISGCGFFPDSAAHFLRTCQTTCFRKHTVVLFIYIYIYIYFPLQIPFRLLQYNILFPRWIYNWKEVTKNGKGKIHTPTGGGLTARRFSWAHSFVEKS
jgi:hypothetical protein